MIKDTRYSTLKVQLFGSFSLYYEGKRLTDAFPRAQHIWKLLKYLLVNRGKFIPSDALIQLLWTDGDVYNPQKALQNLVYRLRGVLPKHEGAPEYILYHHNAYGWNAEVPVEIDAVEFERLVEASFTCSISGETSSCEALCRQATQLYQGEYLEDLAHEEWVLPLAGYYRRLYFQCVDTYIELLNRRAAYDNIIEICERTLAMDCFEERYHALLISALISKGKRAQAAAHFEQITALLKRELGVEPSEILQNAGRQLYMDKPKDQQDINSLLSTLYEPNERQGPYVCDLNIFKELFRVEQRASERTGQSIYLMLLTIVNSNYKIPSASPLVAAMSALRNTCIALLRKSDVMTQSSENQILLLLPSLVYENCERVLLRLERRFYTELGRSGIVLLHKIRPMGTQSAGQQEDPAMDATYNRQTVQSMNRRMAGSQDSSNWPF